MKTGIGQDSHRFEEKMGDKKCIIGGLTFLEVPGWDADSDGDIVFHSICNAITSISGVSILGDIAIKMCRLDKITDSAQYLKKALLTLGHQKIHHVALSIEAGRPRLQSRIEEMRKNIARVLKINYTQVGITCTSGDGLTDFAKGIGGQCFCILTVD